MTDRVKGFTVILDGDIREDDVEELRKAISCLRHVLSVDNVIAKVGDHFERERARHELGQALWKILYP